MTNEEKGRGKFLWRTSRSGGWKPVEASMTEIRKVGFLLRPVRLKLSSDYSNVS